jgi:hypothetical protein
LQTQDVAIEKRQRLVRQQETLDGIRCRAGDVFEEVANLGRPEFVGMLFVMEEDELSGPVGVASACFGAAKGVVGELTNPVEQARRAVESAEARDRGVDMRILLGDTGQLIGSRHEDTRRCKENSCRFAVFP